MSTAAKKLADPKVRRQKQIIAVGSILLLALLGYQLPKLFGGEGDSSSSPAVTSTTVSVATSAVVTPTATLPDTDRGKITPQADQLLSFGLFKSKDPFVPQLSTVSPTAIPAPTTTPAGATPAIPSPVPPTGVPSTPGGTETPSAPPTGVAPTTPATTPTEPTSVALSTNGVCETVAVKGTFPGNQDVLQVVSIARDRKSVNIGVVGGSYGSGQGTATLKQGGKLTLVNAADGTRYVITLKAQCAESQASTTTSAVTSTTPTTTSVVVPTPVAPAPMPTTPAAPTVTATTPIVTDSIDTTTTGTTTTTATTG